MGQSQAGWRGVTVVVVQSQAAGVGVRCYSCAREESILHITPVNTVPHPSQAMLSLTQSTTLPVCLIHHPSCPLLSLTMLCPLPLLPPAPSSIPSFRKELYSYPL